METTKGNLVSQTFLDFRQSNLSDKVFTLLLVFVPIAIICDLLKLPPLIVFAVAALAVVPLAKTMSDSTETLAEKAGPAVGGLLNATFGNAVELIIAVLALLQGLGEVVKASITGSILSNLLLVMGLAFFLGGFGRKFQKFNRVGASASASQLFLAAIALVIPAVFTSTIGSNQSATTRNDLLENLSLLVAGILIVCYIGQLIFFLITHSHLSVEAAESEGSAEQSTAGPGNALTAPRRQPFEIHAGNAEQTPKSSTRRALITLLVATVVVGYVSEILVGNIEPIIKQLGWTELFVGVVLLAIIGNAAEYVAAISAALKNQMNLSVNIAIGSSLQMIFFVTPVLVFVGLFTGHPLSLRFEEFELISIILAVLIVGRVADDGESNWLEGMQLMGAYLIIAVAFFLHP